MGSGSSPLRLLRISGSKAWVPGLLGESGTHQIGVEDGITASTQIRITHGLSDK